MKNYQQYTTTIHDLFNKVKSGSINVNPIYQRDFVLNSDREFGIVNCVKSGQYLAPILLRPLDLAKSKFEVLDGKQRVTSLINEFERLVKLDPYSSELDEYKSIIIEGFVLPIMTDDEAYKFFLQVNRSSVVIRRSEEILGLSNSDSYKCLKSHADSWVLEFMYNQKKLSMSHKRYSIHDTLLRMLSLMNASSLSTIKNSYLNFVNTKDSINIVEVNSFFKLLNKTIKLNLDYMKKLKVKTNNMQVMLLSAAQINTKRHNPLELKQFYDNNQKYFKNLTFQKLELKLGARSSGGEQTNKQEYAYFIEKCNDIKLTPRLFSKVELKNCKCASCSTLVDLQKDHKLPYSKGGTSDESNLQILCSTCNKKKSNKEVYL